MSDRKLRLLACACLRSAWMVLTYREQLTVELAERIADGESKAYADERTGCLSRDMRIGMEKLRKFASANIERLMVEFADVSPLDLPYMCFCGPKAAAGGCIGCGSPGWCPWFTSEVRAIASEAYDRRMDPATLAVLSDALVDAGCITPPKHVKLLIRGKRGGHEFNVVALDVALLHTAGSMRKAKRWAREHHGAKRFMTFGPAWASAEGIMPAEDHPLVTHLRSPGPHFRGCWAVDMILGRY